MREEVNKRRSVLIDWLKVLLTVGIVIRHADLLAQTGQSPAFDAFSRGIMLVTAVCVPLFFVISGYLFFRNVPDRPDWKFFAGKWRSRIFSLLIPYLIANLLAFAAYWLADRYFPEMMSGFLGDDWKKPLFIFWTGPVNLSLWFIRDLVIAVLTAPLIWLVVRYARIWGAIGLVLLSLYFGLPPWCNVYFIAGAWLAICHVPLPDLPERLSLAPSWQGWCFFVYLYHYIPIISLKKILPAVFAPSSALALVATHFAVVVLTLGAVSLAYLLLKKFVPRLAGLLTGGKI